MEREEFVKFISHENTVELIFMGFEYIGNLFETETFIFHNNSAGDVSIINKYTLDNDTPRVINWYKLYHVGRALNITGYMNITELEEARAEIKEELIDLLNSKNILKPKEPSKSKTPDINSLYPKLMLNSLYGINPPELLVFIGKVKEEEKSKC